MNQNSLQREKMSKNRTQTIIVFLLCIVIAAQLLASCGVRQKAQKELEGLRESVERLTQEKDALETKLAASVNAYEYLQQQTNDFQGMIQQFTEQIDDLSRENMKMANELEKYKRDTEALNREVQTAQQEARVAVKRFNELNAEYQDMKAHYSESIDRETRSKATVEGTGKEDEIPKQEKATSLGSISLQ